ncbi:MAG: hypothetical protein VX346_29015 [Planctomycetota bacterium]|nr:hypothetical protein [Planctomycetota bacterium]
MMSSWMGARYWCALVTLVLCFDIDCFAPSTTAAAENDVRGQTVHFIQAEHTHLTGSSQSGGTAVWTYSGSATWDVIVRPATYRLFLRVRAGYAADHESGVRGKTAYRVTVDGRPVQLRLVPGTLLYGSDESNWAWIVGDVGKLNQGPHSLVFTADWHFARWDAFALTADREYLPPREPPLGRETERDLSLLNGQQMKWFQGFSVWPGEVEANCPPTAQPQSANSLKTVGLTACRNQHAAAVVNVTNWLKSPLLFRVSRDDEERPAEAVPVLPAAAVTLRHAVPLPAPRKEALADALPRLDDAGLMLLPPGETRQLWVAVETGGLKPGRYSTHLRMQPLNAPGRCTPQRFEVEVQILNVSLPARHPLDVFVCEYDINRPGMKADLSSHYVNWLHNCLIPHPASTNPDFSSLDDAMARELKYPGARSVFFEQWHFRTDDAWQKPAHRASWIAGIRRWARHVHEDRGLGYDAFTLHIYDEVSGGGVDTFLSARELVREADPKVRVTMTVTPQITLDEVQRLDRGVDVWCPHMELYEVNPEVIAFVRKTGKPVVPYYCAENKRYWPAQMYRRWAWKLYEQRTAGLFMWTWLSRDAWQGRSWDGGMVFAGNGGIVPSRRWELMRMGLEDWLLLDLARQAGHGEQVDELVARVLEQSESAATMRDARGALIQLLSSP